MTSIPLHSKCTKPQWSATATTFGIGSDAPYGLFIDERNEIYVVDFYNHSVQHFIQGWPQGILVAGGTGSGNGPTQLNRPSSVSVDKTGNIYVTDSNNYRVQKFSRDSLTGATVVGGRGSGNQLFQFGRSYGLAVDHDGNIYVSDTDNYRILKFVRGSTIGTVIVDVGELNRPHEVYIDRCNTLYVADYFGHRVRRYPQMNQTAGSTIMGIHQQPGNGSQQLSNPHGLTVDVYGNVFVSDHSNHRIQRLSVHDGTVQTIAGVTGVSGVSSRHLDGPFGIGLDSKGNLYVADHNNHRLQKFAFVGGDLWC
jgi:streptogramin lyase